MSKELQILETELKKIQALETELINANNKQLEDKEKYDKAYENFKLEVQKLDITSRFDPIPASLKEKDNKLTELNNNITISDLYYKTIKNLLIKTSRNYLFLILKSDDYLKKYENTPFRYKRVLKFINALFNDCFDVASWDGYFTIYYRNDNLRENLKWEIWIGTHGTLSKEEAHNLKIDITPFNLTDLKKACKNAPKARQKYTNFLEQAKKEAKKISHRNSLGDSTIRSFIEGQGRF